MTQGQTINIISAGDLHVALLHNTEFAIIDVREARFYAQAHINLAAHFALSSLEPQILHAIPRKSVPIIVVDDEGALTGEAQRAAEVLASLSFTDVRLLQGGIRAWQANGYSVGTGYNTLVKTFADLAHARYSTPTLTPAQLQARLDSGQATTIIDCRPEYEYQKNTVGQAYNVPGAELALYDFDRADEAGHLYVISCFSRTRGIVGTTTLARLDHLPNVAFLEDGIMASFLHGLPVGPGNTQLPPPWQIKSDVVLRQQADRIVQRHGLSVIDHTRYLNFLSERDERSLYVFDIRPEASYRAGHLAHAVSVPGGQLLMTYDAQVPVHNARIVLVDDGYLKRAAVSAFWLSHFDNAEIHLLALDEASVSLTTATIPAVHPETVDWLTPQAAQQRLADGLQVLDVGPSLDYEQGHLPGAHFILRSWLPTWLETRPQGPVLLTSPDGVNAAYGANSLREAGVEAYALKGGTQAWRSAGLAIEVDFSLEQRLSPFYDDWGSTMRATVNREQIFRDYLTWERSLGHDIPRDDTVNFHWPVTVANKAE